MMAFQTGNPAKNTLTDVENVSRDKTHVPLIFCETTWRGRQGVLPGRRSAISPS